MRKTIKRRSFLAAGAASAGLFCGAGKTLAGTKVKKRNERLVVSRAGQGSGKRFDARKNPGQACVHDQKKTMMNYPETGTITEAVKQIRDSGYSSANINYSVGTRNRWLDASESEISELRQALKKYDVEIFDTMVWTNLIHPDEATRQKNLKYVAENVEAADRLGCRMVTAVTGSCDPEFYIGMHPDNWTGGTWKLTVASIRQILRDTSGAKTVLGMEAVITTNLDGPEAHKRLMTDVADPRCKVCLDPTNMLSFERYYHSTELLNECFDTLGEDILACHGKDVFITRGKMLCYTTEVPPGKGVQDYETYLARISRMKWPRTLLLEHFPEEQYPAIRKVRIRYRGKDRRENILILRGG